MAHPSQAWVLKLSVATSPWKAETKCPIHLGLLMPGTGLGILIHNCLMKHLLMRAGQSVGFRKWVWKEP